VALPDGEYPKLVISDYGSNTPTSTKKRRSLLSGKGVWVHIKRIKKKSLREVVEANAEGDLRRVASGHTHVCVRCWQRLICTRDWQRGGAFITTVPNDHNRKFHKEDLGKESQERVDESAYSKTKALLFVGLDRAGASPPPPPPPSSSSSSSGMSPYYVSPQDKALAAAARTYIYGKGQLSKATFDDEEFRAMSLKACCGISANPPFASSSVRITATKRSPSSVRFV